GVAMMDLDMKIVRGDPRNPAASILPASGFNDQDHVLVCTMTYRPEKSAEFRFDEPAIERELAPGKCLRGRKRGLGLSWRGCILRLGFMRCGVGESKARGMLRHLPLHRVHRFRGR